MHLQYGTVELQIEHTSEVSIEPVMDPSGVDMLYQRITISMICVWNPFATTSNPPGLGPAPNILNSGGAGDRLGTALALLKQQLMTPQLPLKVWIAQDRTFDVPPRIDGTLFNPALAVTTPQAISGSAPAAGATLQAACDVGGGPFPQHCRVVSISGDKTAVVDYRIVFHVRDNSTFILSHRWKTTSHTRHDWLTTRTLEGRAIFRRDLLAFNGVVPDQWRRNFAQPVPNGFIRKEVNCVATEDGRELYYRVTDQQLALNLGVNSAAIRVDGHVSTGAAWPFKDVVGAMREAGKAKDAAIDAGMGLLLNPVMGLVNAGADLAAAGMSAMPHPRAMAVIRVHGPHGADRTKLASLAAAIAADRLVKSKILNTFFPLSAFMTQNVSSEEGPYAEVTIEALVSSLAMFSAVWNPAANLAAHLNSSNTVLDGNGAIVLNPAVTVANPPFPGDAGCRGTWVAAMVSQVFMQQGVVVPAVPGPDAPGTTPTPPVFVLG